MHISILNVLKSSAIRKAASLCWNRASWLHCPQKLFLHIIPFNISNNVCLGKYHPNVAGTIRSPQSLTPSSLLISPCWRVPCMSYEWVEWRSGGQTHGPKHHWEPQPSTMDPDGTGVSVGQYTGKTMEGKMEILGGVNVYRRSNSNKSSKKKQGACGKVPTPGGGISRMTQTGVSSD